MKMGLLGWSYIMQALVSSLCTDSTGCEETACGGFPGGGEKRKAPATGDGWQEYFQL